MGEAERRLFEIEDLKSITRNLRNKHMINDGRNESGLSRRDRTRNLTTEDRERNYVHSEHSLSSQRANARESVSAAQKRFGGMKDSLLMAKALGHKDPKDAQAYNDFLYKIAAPDAKGNLQIMDERTIGWSEASSASWFLSNAEMERGITARNANNIQINMNLMRGGIREYYESEGLQQYRGQEETERELDATTVAGDGWNMNPLNYAESFDAFGLIDSPDLQALRYKDPNFNAESYLDNIAEINPQFASLMTRSGVDMETLKQTGNANQFWWHVNRGIAMVGAANTIAHWKESVPAYQEWAMMSKDFVRDSLMNDPDFAGELVVSGLLALATGGSSLVALGAYKLAKNVNRGKKAARVMVRAARQMRKAAQKANNALPQNWGLSIGYGLRKTAVGRFLNVTSDDFIVDGMKFGTTRKYGSKFTGYLMAELPAGFVEEGIAGAYNAYSMNKTQVGRDQNLFKAFIDEGISGSLVRALGINPALRSINFGMRYTGARAEKYLIDNFGSMFDSDADGMGWSRSIGAFFQRAKQIASVGDTVFLENELDALDVMIALDDLNLTEAELVAEIEGSTMEELVNKHPALAAIATMLEFDTEGNIIGRETNADGTQGELKLVKLIRQTREQIARKRLGIDRNEDLRDNPDDTEDVRKHKAAERAKIDQEIKEGTVTKDEFNLALMGAVWGKLDSKAKSASEARAHRDAAYFQMNLRALALEKHQEMLKENKDATFQDAFDAVLNDPDLLIKMDQGGVTREIDQIIGEQHPELFDKVTDEVTGEEYFVPKKDTEDRKYSEEVAKHRRNTDFDTQLAAIKAHRKRLGIVKDVRFAISDALQEKANTAFRDLNAKINHEASYNTVREFLLANDDGSTLLIDEGKGLVEDIEDADIIEVRVNMRGVKLPLTLTVRRPGAFDAKRKGQKLKKVSVIVQAKTIESYGKVTAMLNKLQIVKSIDEVKAAEKLRPIIRQAIAERLGIEDASDADLVAMFTGLRRAQGRELTEAEKDLVAGLKSDAKKNRERKVNSRTAIVDIIQNDLTEVAVGQLSVQYFDGVGLDSSNVLERLSDPEANRFLLTIDNARKEAEENAALSDVLGNLGSIFNIEIVPDADPRAIAEKELNRKIEEAREKAMGLRGKALAAELERLGLKKSGNVKAKQERLAQEYARLLKEESKTPEAEPESEAPAEPEAPAETETPAEPETPAEMSDEELRAAMQKRVDEEMEVSARKAGEKIGEPVGEKWKKGKLRKEIKRLMGKLEGEGVDFGDLGKDYKNQNLTLNELNNMLIDLMMLSPDSQQKAREGAPVRVPKVRPEAKPESTPTTETETQEDVQEEDPVAEEALQAVEEAMDENAQTEDANTGDEIVAANNAADTGEIAAEDDGTVSDDIKESAAIRRENQQNEDEVTESQRAAEQNDKSAQRVKENYDKRRPEILRELRNIEAERERLRDEAQQREGENFDDEDFAMRDDVVELDKQENKLQKELAEMEKALGNASQRVAEKNKDALTKAQAKAEELRDRENALAPDMDQSIAENVWAQIEVRRMKIDKANDARRILRKLKEKNPQPSIEEIHAALLEVGFSEYDAKTIAKYFTEEVNAAIEADKKLSKKEKERKKLTNIQERGDTKISQEHFDKAYEAFRKRLKTEAEGELTQRELRQAKIMALYGKEEWERVQAATNPDIELDIALEGNDAIVPVRGKPFTGLINVAFDPANRNGIDMSDDDKAAVLNASNQLALIKALERAINNLITIEGRTTITSAELASFALAVGKRKGFDVNVGALFAKMNWAVIFRESMITGVDEGVEYFDPDNLLDELMMHKARLEFKNRGKKTKLRALEAQKESLSRDEYLQDEELLLEETLEIAEGDSDTLRALGQVLFRSETSSLKGQFLVGIDPTSRSLVRTTNKEEYEAAVLEAISERMGMMFAQPRKLGKIVNFLVEQGLLDPEYRDNTSPDETTQQMYIQAVAQYLRTYPGNKSGELASWGNGDVSYSFADQVGMGIVDTLAGEQIGTTHEQIEDYDDDYDSSGAKIHGSDRMDPIKHRGAPIKINMAEPMLPGRLERLKEDHRLMMVNQFIMELDLTEDEIKMVFDFMDAPDKVAVGVVADRAKFIAGERPMPRIIFADPTAQLQSRQELLEDMAIALSGLHDVLLSSIHDSINIKVDGESRPGGFLDEGVVAELYERHGIGLPGTTVAIPGREDALGRGAGEAGGFGVAGARFGTLAYHLTRSFGKMYPAFRDTAIEGLATWEAFSKAINEATDIGIKSAEEALSKDTYFDGNFNGIHHKMALSFTFTEMELDWTFPADKLRAAIADKGDALDRFLFDHHEMMGDRFVGRYKDRKKEDYYIKSAHDVLISLFRRAFRGTGREQRDALETVTKLQEIGFLPETLSEVTFEDGITIDNLLDAEEYDKVRALFKKPVMTYLYGAKKDTINKEFRTFLVDEMGMSFTEAQKISDPLTRIALGYGLKSRQIALTDLTNRDRKEDPLLKNILGDDSQLDSILQAMRTRMDAHGFTDDNQRKLREHIRDMMVDPDNPMALEDITFNNLAFQIQMRDSMIEGLIQGQLGYEPGTPEYNRVKSKINRTMEKASDKQMEFLENRIRKGIERLSVPALTSDTALLQLTDEELETVPKVVGILLTKPKSEWSKFDEVQPYLDKNGNISDEPVGEVLNLKKNMGSFIRHIRVEINEGITREEAQEVQRVADEAIEPEEGLFKAIKAMGEVGRKLDMVALDQLMEFAGIAIGDPNMRNTLEKYYKNNVTYRGIGRDGYAGRWYGTEHEGTHQGPKGAQDQGEAADEPLLAMGAMLKVRNDVNEAKAEEMFARYLLHRTANAHTNVEHIVVTLAKKKLEGEKDPDQIRRLKSIIAIMTPDNELTDEQKVERDIQFFEDWQAQYEVAKAVEDAVKNRGGFESLTDSERQQVKLSSMLTQATATHGMDPEVVDMPATTVEELEDRKINLGQNHGMFATRAKAFDTSFRNLGVPEFKKIRINRILEGTGMVTGKIQNLRDFIENAEESDALLIEQEHVDNLLENPYSTEPNDLLYPELNIAESSDIAMAASRQTIQKYATSLRTKLIRFAYDHGLIELIQRGEWQRVDYLMKVRIIRDRNHEQRRTELNKLPAELSREELNKRREEIIHRYRRKTAREIKLINKRARENADAISTIVEMAPGGNVSTISQGTLVNKDGTAKNVGEILNTLRNELNNLGAYGALSPVEGVAMDDLSRAVFVTEETADRPRIVHASDAAHILTTIIDMQDTADFLRKEGRSLVETIIKRNDLDITVEEFTKMLPVYGKYLTLDEAIYVIDELDKKDDLKTRNILTLAKSAYLGQIDQDETETALRGASSRRGLVAGTGEVVTENKIKGTTGRIKLTLAQARQALLNIRNSTTLDLITDTKYTGISHLNKHKSRGTRLDQVDHVTGERISEMRLRDEVHAEAMQYLVDEYNVREGKPTELNTSLKVVVGGRDRSMLARTEPRNRRLPRMGGVFADGPLRKKRGTQQAVYLDYSEFEAEPDRLHTGVIKAQLAAWKQLDVLPEELESLIDIQPPFRGEKLRLLKQQRVLGYLATHYSISDETRVTIPAVIKDGKVQQKAKSFGSVAVNTALAFMELYGNTPEMRVTEAGVTRSLKLEEVLQLPEVQRMIAKAETWATTALMVRTGENNKYYDEARGFVMWMAENPASFTSSDEAELDIQFFEYLKSKNKDIDLLDKTEMKSAQNALRKAISQIEVEPSMQSREVPLTFTVSPEAARKNLENTVSGVAFKNTLEQAVADGYITETTKDIVLAVVARISASNSDFLNKVDIQFGANKSRAISKMAGDRYLIELSTADGKKNPMTAAKILLHELVHIGTYKYYNLESTSDEMVEIRELTRFRSVQKLMYDLTSAFSKGDRTATFQRHRQFMKHPEEFIAESAAMFWLTEAREEIEQILADAEDRIEFSEVEDAGKQSFIKRIRNAIVRSIDSTRNTLRSMIAVMAEYEKYYGEEGKAELAKMKELAFQAAGIVVKNGKVDASLVAKPNNTRYTRHHDGSETGTMGEKTDDEVLNLLKEIREIKNQINDQRDIDGNDLSAEQLSALGDELEAKSQELDIVDGEPDEFGTFRSQRIIAEQELIDNGRFRSDGVLAVDMKPLLAEKPGVALTILTRNLRNNNGKIHRGFLDRMALNREGLNQLTLGPSQNDMTYDSIYDLAVQLSLVIDQQILMTEHMINPEGTSDLLRAKQKIDNQLAFLRGQIRGNKDIKPEQERKILYYLAHPKAKPETGEEALHDVAQLMRTQFNDIIDLAKDTGLLFKDLDYDPVPIKINEQVLMENRDPIMKSLSADIAKKIRGNMAEAIDPITLMSSGLLPPILTTSVRTNPNSLAPDQKKDFVNAVQKLAKTESGRRVIEHAISMLSPEQREQFEGYPLKELTTFKYPVGGDSVWKVHHVMNLMIAFEALYEKGFKQQGFRKGTFRHNVLIEFVNEKRNRQQYIDAISSQIDTVQYTIMKANKKFNISSVKATSLDPVESRDVPVYSPATYRAELFLGEVQSGVRFLAHDKVFEPNAAEIVSQMQETAVDRADGTHTLGDAFIVDSTTLIEGVGTGLGFDANATKALGHRARGKGYEVEGIRFDDILGTLLETGSDAIIRDAVLTSGVRDGLKRNRSISGLRESLKVIQNKYDTLAGRRVRVDKTQGSGLQNRLASMGSDLVLASYGGNLALATSIVEGTATAFQMAGRGDMLRGPAMLLKSMLIGGAQGTLGGLVKAGRLFGFESNRFQMKNTAAELAYAFEHTRVRGMETGSDDSSLVTGTTLEKIQAGIGQLPRSLADAATGASSGVTNGIKYAVEGLAINTLNRLIRSGGLMKMAKFLESDKGKELLRITGDYESKMTSVLYSQVREILKSSGLSDFSFLGKHDVKVFMAMMDSGLLRPDFLKDLNDLINVAGLEQFIFDGSASKYSPRSSALTHIAQLQRAALMTQDKAKRDRFMNTLSQIKEYVNREIEARFVGGNPLQMDTANSASAILFKIFRSYPTLFFGQRLRQDSRYYGPLQNAIRIANLVALDMMYMVASSVASGGLDDDRTDLLMKEIQQKDSLIRLLARTPTFGMYGGEVAAALAEAGIFVTGGKGYTQNLLNQAFIPIPLAKIQSSGVNGLLNMLKYAGQHGAQADARFNLALMNLITSLPVLQEAYTKAAIHTYFSTPMMRKLENDKLQRKINAGNRVRGGVSGGSGGGSSGRVYYGNPEDFRSNPGALEFAADRNIWPDDLVSYDMMAVLGGEPLPNLMGSPPIPNQEKAPTPSRPAAPPPPAPEAPQKEIDTSPSLRAVSGSPSARVAESLGQFA